MTIAPVSTSASTSASSGATGADRLDSEIDRFEATGEVSQGLVEEAQAAGAEAFAQRLDRLPPARRGALEGALADKGLLGLVGDTAGSLVGGTVDTAVGVVDVAADGAVETRSERQVEDARENGQDQRMSSIQAQSHFDAVLSPARRLNAPPAPLDWAAAFPSPVDQPAVRADPR